MAARGPDAGRDRFALPRAGPAPRPEVRAGLRRRHRGASSPSCGARSSKQLAEATTANFFRLVQQGRGVKVRILGCGTSTGVPKIGNDWGQCDPPSRATAACAPRSWSKAPASACWSIAGPDLRQQLLAAEVGRLDGVIVTHAHGDHCHGIDELAAGRRRRIGGPVPLYARARRARRARAALRLCLRRSRDFYRPIVEARELGDELTLRRCAMRASSTSRTAAPTSLGLRFDEGGRSVGLCDRFQ